MDKLTDRSGGIYDSVVDQASDVKPRRPPLRRWMLVVAIALVGLIGVVLGALEQASTPPPKPFQTVLPGNIGPPVNVNEGQSPLFDATRLSLGAAAAHAPAGHPLLVPHDELATAGQEVAVWLSPLRHFEAALEYPSGILIMIGDCRCAGVDTLTDFEAQRKSAGPRARIKTVGGRIALEGLPAAGPPNNIADVLVRANGYNIEVSGATSIANVERVAASLQPISSNL